MLTVHQLYAQHHARSGLYAGLVRAERVQDGLQRLRRPVPVVPTLGWKSERLGAGLSLATSFSKHLMSIYHGLPLVWDPAGHRRVRLNPPIGTCI